MSEGQQRDGDQALRADLCVEFCKEIPCDWMRNYIVQRTPAITPIHLVMQRLLKGHIDYRREAEALRKVRDDLVFALDQQQSASTKVTKTMADITLTNALTNAAISKAQNG